MLLKLQLIYFIFAFIYLRLGYVNGDCDATSVYFHDLGITLHFDTANAGSFAGSQEICSSGSLSLAYIECLSSSEWTLSTRIITPMCSFTSNATLMAYFKDQLIYGNNFSIFQNIPYGQLVMSDIEFFINFFNETTSLYENISKNLTVDKRFQAKSNIFNFYSKLLVNTRFLFTQNSSITLLNNFLRSIENSATFMSTTNVNKKEMYDTEGFIVIVIPALIFNNTTGISFTNISNGISFVLPSTNKISSNDEVNIEITISNLVANTLVNLTSKLNDLSAHLNFIIYKRNDYFTRFLNDTPPYKNIIAATISEYSSIKAIFEKNYPNEDFINFVLSGPSYLDSSLKNGKLSYYVFGNSSNLWSQDGCALKKAISTSNYKYSCNHLTHFAVLLNVDPYAPSISTENNRVLSIITYVCVGLSIAGLLITLLTFICFSQKCIFNLSLSLLLMYITFIINTLLAENSLYASKTSSICVFLAVLLHYFLIASFLWMLVMAFIQYAMFVKVFPQYISEFTIKACCFSWGLPFIPIIISVALNFSPSIQNQLPGGFVYGQLENICWIQGIPFYILVVLPTALIVLLNTFVFIAVAFNLIKRAINQSLIRQVSASSKRKKDVQRYKRSCSAIFACFIILGCTWAFGFLAVGQAKTAFAYLFSLFNSLQGFFVFIAFVFLSRSKKRLWANKARKMKSMLASTTLSHDTPSRNPKKEPIQVYHVSYPNAKNARKQKTPRKHIDEEDSQSNSSPSIFNEKNPYQLSESSNSRSPSDGINSKEPYSLFSVKAPETSSISDRKKEDSEISEIKLSMTPINDKNPYLKKYETKKELFGETPETNAFMFDAPYSQNFFHNMAKRNKQKRKQSVSSGSVTLSFKSSNN